MVGDWVMLTDPINNGEKVQVKEIHGDGYITVVGGITKMYEPISLTDDILKKIGFGYVEKDVNPYDGKVLSHFYLGYECFCANMDLHICTYNDGIFWFSSPKLSLNGIRYLHQLQHALRLAGIDKEITL